MPRVRERDYLFETSPRATSKVMMPDDEHNAGNRSTGGSRDQAVSIAIGSSSLAKSTTRAHATAKLHQHGWFA
jgi:hypothetical protein